MTESTQQITLHACVPWLVKLKNACTKQPHDSENIAIIKGRPMELLNTKFIIHQLHLAATALHLRMKSLRMLDTVTDRERAYTDLRSRAASVLA